MTGSPSPLRRLEVWLGSRTWQTHEESDGKRDFMLPWLGDIAVAHKICLVSNEREEESEQLQFQSRLHQTIEEELDIEVELDSTLQCCIS